MTIDSKVLDLKRLLEDLDVIKCHLIALSFNNKDFDKDFVAERIQFILNYLQNINK